MKKIVIQRDTLYPAFQAAAEAFAERPALREGERVWTYRRLHEEVRHLSCVLMEEFALGRGEAVAVFAEKSFAWPLVSLALQAAGAVEFPRECTIETEELRHFLNLHTFRLVFVQNEAMLGRLAVAESSRPGCTVLLMEPPADPHSAPPAGWEVIELDRLGPGSSLPEGDRLPVRVSERSARVRPDDTAAVIRTSGTTGEPKFVPLSHKNFLANMRTLPGRVGLGPTDRILSCLPAWHLYARIVEYTGFLAGSEIVYCQIPEISTALRDFRPTLFPGFPEIWERAYHRILSELEGHSAPVRTLFRLCLVVSRARYAGRETLLGCGWRPTPATVRELPGRFGGGLVWALCEAPHRLADFLLYRRIRSVFGGRLRLAVIGDAPLPRFIDENLRALGFRVLEGYGSTEQNVSAVRSPRCNALATAGTALPGTRLLIVGEQNVPLPAGTTGRIAVAGPAVFAGYERPGNTETPEFFEFEGERFYRTGDMGQLDVRGTLRIIGREKNRFRLAGGGIVYPERVENVLRGSKFISQTLVTGRDRPYLYALIVPDLEELVLFLRRRLRPVARVKRGRPLFHPGWNTRFAQRPEFLERIVRLPAVHALFESEVQRLCERSDLAVFEQPQRILLVGTPFVPGRELTPTLKLRRTILERQFGSRLEELYARGDFAPGPRPLRMALVRAGLRLARSGNSSEVRFP